MAYPVISRFARDWHMEFRNTTVYHEWRNCIRLVYPPDVWTPFSRLAFDAKIRVHDTFGGIINNDYSVLETTMATS